MADYDIGTARGTIEVNSSQIGRAVSALDLMANRMLLVGGVVAAGFGLAIKSAADFETQLDRFRAVSDASEEDMARVAKAAKTMGVEAGIGATAVAEGWVEIAKAGYGVDEVLAGIGKSAVQLAAAGEIDMARSTEILVNTLRTFSLQGSDAERVANILAGAANASTIEIDDLGTTLRYIGPVAAAAGISLESTAEAAALLGNSGLKGSTAGTSLRGILVALTKPSEAATNSMKDLGIITEDGANKFFTAEGKLRSFAEISQILQDHTKGLTEEQKLNALATIFQRRAMAAAAVMTREGSAGFDKLRNSAQFSTTAQEVMATKLDNLRGQWNKAKATLENLAITVGEMFIPVLRKLLEHVQKLLDWWNELDPATQQLIVKIIAAVGAFLLLQGAAFKLGSAILRNYRAARDMAQVFRIMSGLFPKTAKLLSTLWGGFSKLATVLFTRVIPAIASFTVALLTNPITWIVVGVVAAIAALVALYVYWDKIWSFIMDNKWIGAIIAIFFPWIAAIFLLVGAIKYLIENWDKVWAWVKQAAKDIVKWVVQAFDDVVEFFKKLPGRVMSALKALPGFLLKVFAKLVEGAWNVFGEVVHFLAYLAGYIIGAIIGLSIRLVIEGAKALWGLLTGFWNALPDILDFFLELPFKILALLVDAGMWLIETGFKLLMGLLNGLIGWVGNIATWFIELPGRILGWLGDTAGTLFWKGVDLVVGIFNGLVNSVHKIITWFTELPGKIVNSVGDWGSSVARIGKGIVEGIWEAIKGLKNWLMDKIEGFIGGLLGGIGDFLGIGSPAKALFPYGRAIVQGLQVGIDQQSARALRDMETLAAGLMARAAIQGNVAVGSIGAAPVPSTAVPGSAAGAGRTTQINNDNKFYGLDPKETAKEVMRESTWYDRTSGGGMT